MPTGAPTPTPPPGPGPSPQYLIYAAIAIASFLAGGIVGYLLHG
jgi:hypothetical protein